MGRIFSAVLTILAAKSFSYPVPVDVNGEVARWPIDRSAPTVTFEVKETSGTVAQTFQQMVSEAASMWSNVGESYVELRQGITGEKANITVEFVDSVSSDASAGYAQFDEFKNGKPSHCTIKVVSNGYDVSENLSRTVLHELGHCLGLGHSVIPDAVMSYSLNQNGYRLSIDDEAALSRLYPAGEDEPKLPPGCSVGSRREDLPMKRRYFAFLFLLPLAFLFYKRLGI